MKKLTVLFALLLAGSVSFSQKQAVQFYVGTQDKGANSSISLCELDLGSGTITLLDTFNQCVGPGYVAVSPDKNNLYAVTGDNKITAFRIGADKKLTYLNSQSSEGANPCHVSVHPSGKMAFAANYTGGSFTAYTLAADGKLNAPAYQEQYSGTGPNTKRQEKAHAHFAAATPDGKYVFVTDLGSDKVMNYIADVKTGKLIPNPAQPFFVAKPGSGPRHLVIHPSGKALFLLNELEATLTSCTIDKQGRIAEVKTYPTLPSDFQGTNTSSAIHLHPNGKFVYVSNRGHNSISAFRIGEAGALEMVDQQTKSIATPRDFNIDPSGKFMVVANQTADNLVVYDVDPATGKFKFRQESIGIKLPICVAFL